MPTPPTDKNPATAPEWVAEVNRETREANVRIAYDPAHPGGPVFASVGLQLTDPAAAWAAAQAEADRLAEEVRAALVQDPALSRVSELARQADDLERQIRHLSAQGFSLAAQRGALEAAHPVPRDIAARLVDIDGQLAEVRAKAGPLEPQRAALRELLVRERESAAQLVKRAVDAATGKRVAELVVRGRKLAAEVTGENLAANLSLAATAYLAADTVQRRAGSLVNEILSSLGVKP